MDNEETVLSQLLVLLDGLQMLIVEDLFEDDERERIEAFPNWRWHVEEELMQTWPDVPNRLRHYSTWHILETYLNYQHFAAAAKHIATKIATVPDLVIESPLELQTHITLFAELLARTVEEGEHNEY